MPEAKVEGDRVEFSAFLPGSDDTELIFSGKAGGDRLNGTVTVRQGRKNTKQAWKAERREGTSERIDY